MFKKFFMKDEEEEEVYETVDPVLEQRRKEKFSTPLIYNEEEEEKKQEDVSEEVPVDHPVEKEGDDGEARQNGPAFAGDDGIRREFVHCGMLQ